MNYLKLNSIIFNNKKEIGILSLIILGTIIFFYLPFSFAIEFFIFIIFLMRLLSFLFSRIAKIFLKKKILIYHFPDRLSLHMIVLVFLLYFAPQDGGNKKIDTSKWNECTLEEILKDINNQTGFFVQVNGFHIFSDKIANDPETQEILKQKINWDHRKLTAAEAAYYLTEKSDAEVTLGETTYNFYRRSISGHWLDYSITVLKKRD
jgi:energy-coupling factor transporter transmembrane protein EcfT